MKRRKFLSDSFKLLATPLLIQGTPLRALSGFEFPLNVCDIRDDRAVVIIKLGGGNDGLNTIIPLSQYSRYASIRPSIKLPQSGLLELDKNLAQDYAVGLHPELSGFKNIYNNPLKRNGTSAEQKVNMNIVNSVSYPNNSRSHFRSTDLMLKGISGTATQDSSAEETTGWMARFLNSGYDPSKSADPLGIQLGHPKPSLGFLHEHDHTISLNLSGQDLQGYYNQIANFNSANVMYGMNSYEMVDLQENIRHILDIESDMNNYAARISDVFDKGSNSSVSYGSNSIGAQLKTVARLVIGGCTTKIYLCHMGGFDTHSSQLTRHKKLMKDLNDAISGFYQDLVNLEVAEQILTVTFSEFGRKAKENGNGSAGTDHGTLAPMMLFGTGVVNGVTGKNPDLTNLTSGGQLQAQTGNPIQDYRRVFTTVIQDWLGASKTDLKETLWGSFGSQKLDLIDSNQKVPSTCYNGASQLAKWNKNDVDISQFETQIYPNPCVDHFELQINAPHDSRIKMTVYSSGGKLVKSENLSLRRGSNTIRKEIRWNSGWYYVQLHDQKGEQIDRYTLVVQ